MTHRPRVRPARGYPKPQVGAPSATLKSLLLERRTSSSKAGSHFRGALSNLSLVGHAKNALLLDLSLQCYTLLRNLVPRKSVSISKRSSLVNLCTIREVSETSFPVLLSFISMGIQLQPIPCAPKVICCSSGCAFTSTRRPLVSLQMSHDMMEFCSPARP